MKTFDFAVVGNGVAAMVGATELARNGHSVVLWNPTPQWGAHFGGFNAAGRSFDIGMNLLEFTSFAAQSSQLETYSAPTRNDSARFTGVIRDYISGLVDCAAAEVPQCLFRGVFAPDIVIANRLDLLGTLPGELRSRIAAELDLCVKALDQSPAWHARNKVRQAEQFAAADYRTVSLANHGATLHDLLIEPACQRTLGLPASEVSALLHRVAWTPLYYPETLLQQLEGPPPVLPPTDFSYPQAGSFAAVISALEQRIRIAPGLEVVRDKLGSLTRVEGGWMLNNQALAQRLVWTQRPGQLAAALGGEDDLAAYTKASVVVAFASIDRDAWMRRFSTVFVLDANSPIYRITDQTWSAGSQVQPQADCTIEIAAAAAAHWPLDNLPALTAEITSQLKRLGVLREAAGVTLHAAKLFKDVIVAPTAANRSRALAGHAHLTASHPEIELIGAAAPFGASSFNDYVIQGLRLGRRHQPS
jgi:hypothetical protein